jgi:hypothetical protein
MSSRSCSSPSKKDSARGGMPSTQLVLDVVSTSPVTVVKVSPYRYDDATQPKSGALHLERLVLLEWHPSKVLAYTCYV